MPLKPPETFKHFSIFYLWINKQHWKLKFKKTNKHPSPGSKDEAAGLGLGVSETFSHTVYPPIRAFDALISKSSATLIMNVKEIVSKSSGRQYELNIILSLKTLIKDGVV